MTTTQESWITWFCELEAGDYYLMNQSEAKGVDGNFPSNDKIAPEPQEENFQQSFSNNNKHSHSTFKTGNSSAMSMSNSSSEEDYNNNFEISRHSKTQSYILSFDSNVNSAPILNVDSNLKPKGKFLNQKKRKETTQLKMKMDSLVRSPQHAEHHIIAERQRREKINQQFIALSALIPGLKKMDKATVLGEAIKHVKQLQEQVKKLEEEQSKRKTIESSVIHVEKSAKCSADEDFSDTSSNFGYGNLYEPSKTKSLLEVEARVSEKNVLIRIHCEKQKGVLTNVLKEIERVHLSVINSSVLLFGTSKLDITIVAEMDDEFSLGVKELARSLQVGLKQ